MSKLLYTSFATCTARLALIGYNIYFCRMSTKIAKDNDIMVPVNSVLQLRMSYILSGTIECSLMFFHDMGVAYQSIQN